MTWILPASLAFVAWGLWAFFVKLATFSLSARSVFLYQMIGIAIATVVCFLVWGFPKETHAKGSMYAIVAGMLVVIGEPLFTYAVTRGKASIVTVFVAMYPILTVILAFLILHEALTIKQGLGILCALSAVLLFTL